MGMVVVVWWIAVGLHRAVKKSAGLVTPEVRLFFRALSVTVEKVTVRKIFLFLVLAIFLPQARLERRMRRKRKIPRTSDFSSTRPQEGPLPTISLRD
jgi:hypothetical protein